MIRGLLLGDHMYGDHMDGGWAFLMGAFMLLMLVVVVLLAVWLVRGWTPRATPGTDASQGRETAMDVLDRRLAAGEITPDEYRERAELLRAR